MEVGVVDFCRWLHEGLGLWREAILAAWTLGDEEAILGGSSAQVRFTPSLKLNSAP